MSHRSVVLGQLHSYLPASEEILTKKQMIAFIEENPQCFERSLEIGHITASAWLLNKDGTKALLMHHAKLDRWVQLGGHCDGESNVLRAAIKEAQEESGIVAIEPITDAIFDLDIHEIPEKGTIKAHLHYDIRYLLQVRSDEVVKQNHESKELRWVESDLPTSSRSVIRMFEKWKFSLRPLLFLCADKKMSLRDTLFFQQAHFFISAEKKQRTAEDAEKKASLRLNLQTEMRS